MKRYVNEHGEHMVQMTLNERGPLTDEEKEMLKRAREKAPVFDEDCPPLSEALHRQIQSRIARKHRMMQGNL